MKYKRFKTLPFIKQSEIAECGLCCLAMVADYHHSARTLPFLRSRYNSPSRGTTLKALSLLSKDVGLNCKAFKTKSLEYLRALKEPWIAHWEGNHYVVVRKVGKKSVVVHDPACGVKTLDVDSFNDSFTGVALKLTSDQEKSGYLKGQFSDPEGLRTLVGSPKGLIKISLFVLLGTIALQTISALSPIYVQIVVDKVITGGDLGNLNGLTLGFIGILAAELLFRVAREFSVLALYKIVNRSVSQKVFSHLLRKRAEFFQKRQPGDVLSRMESISSIRSIVANDLISSVVDAVLVLIVVSIMFYYSATLTAMAVITAVIYMVFRLFLYKKIKVLVEKELSLKGEEDSALVETINAIKPLKLFGRESSRVDLHLKKNEDILECESSRMRWDLQFRVVQTAMFGLANIVAIYLGATYVKEGSLSIGMMFAFIAYLNMFFNSFDWLVIKLMEARTIQVHVDRLSDISSCEEISDEGECGRSAAKEMRFPNHGDILISGLCFRYTDNDPWVFYNKTLEIPIGKTTAITGRSGCGKSSLVSCLLGFSRAEKGSIVVEENIEHDLSKYKKYVSAVTQDDSIISGTLKDNVVFYNAKTDLGLLEKCASISGLAEIASDLPMGYDTAISATGSNFSGGQLQRVLLTRALYQEPKILFLDEATSQLDSDSELDVMRELKKLGITVVLVAHRRETIGLADNIVVME